MVEINTENSYISYLDSLELRHIIIVCFSQTVLAPQERHCQVTKIVVGI